MLDRVSPAKTGSIAGILLISLSMLPMLQGALITPLLAVIRESAGDRTDATFLLRLMMVAPAFAMMLLIPLVGRFFRSLRARAHSRSGAHALWSLWIGGVPIA